MAHKAPIALVAGEASGDQLGAALITAARRLDPEVRFVGVAGPAMRAAGCEAWHAAEDLSVMGLAEVLRHLPRLVGIRNRLLARLLRDPPAAFVGIDAPDFNLRIAPALRAAGIPTVQYVCPQVWAWRAGRLHHLREACDLVLCLLPFEVDLLGTAGVPALFVGHPFADQIGAATDPAPARARLGIEADRSVIGLLPGSRHAEVARLGLPFLEAASLIARQRPGTTFLAALLNPGLRSLFERQRSIVAPDLPLQMLDGRARDVMAASDGVLVASGTASLETMLVNRPMVVAYRLAPLTYWLARTFRLVQVRHFALPNLLAGEALVPEVLQGEASASRLAGELLALLGSPTRCADLGARFAAIGRDLRRGASEQAARAVLRAASGEDSRP